MKFVYVVYALHKTIGKYDSFEYKYLFLNTILL